MDPESGPNWDDDLGGSPVYAANDPNLKVLSATERAQLFEVERLVMFYLPRTCNHCLNPACVASCPSGALYKRGEDGAVLVDQNRCRGWRACVAACPYKKTFYNWTTGKSEKCILCYPRVETGQAPACFHSCVGRIRYAGVLLYDADRIEEVASVPERELVEAHRSLILDPRDPRVLEHAQASGVHAGVVAAAQASPVYRFVKEWGLALPLHLEFRTLPTLFYVPPLSPVLAGRRAGAVENTDAGFFEAIDEARIPIRYMASLFSVGQDGPVRYALRKQQAVRAHRRALTVGDLPADVVDRQLQAADCSAAEAEAIYRLTALCRASDRFVLPPAQRESSAVTS
jgi:nitrate reductase beta subunit